MKTHLPFVLSVLFSVGVRGIPAGEFQTQLASIDSNFSQQGATMDVLSQYDVLLRQTPEDMDDLERSMLLAKVYYKKAIIGLSLGKEGQSILDFEKSLELNPGNSGVKKNLLELIVKYGQRERLERARKIIGDDDDLDLAVTMQQLKIIDDLSREDDLEKLSEAIQMAPFDVPLREKRIAMTEKALKSANPEDQIALFTGLVDDLNIVIKMSPAQNSANWNKLSEIYLFGLGEYNNALNANKKCLHYDMDFDACKRNSKFLNKYSQILTQLSNQHRYFEHLKSEESDDEVPQMTEMDFKDVATLLTSTDKFLKIRRENDKFSTNLAFIESKSQAFNKHYGIKHNALEQTLHDSLAMDALLRHDLKSFKTQIPHLSDTSLAKKLEQIDRWLHKKDFNKAHSEIQSCPKNMRQTSFILERLEKIQRHQQQQQHNHRQQQRHRQAPPQQQRKPKNDYYKILGVPKDADDRTIKKAYRDLTKQFHPDKYKGDLPAEEVEHKMTQINHAYEVLSDEQMRKDYDAGHDPNDPESRGGGGGGAPQGNPFGGAQFRSGNPFGGGSFNFNFGKGAQFGNMRGGPNAGRANKGTFRRGK